MHQICTVDLHHEYIPGADDFKQTNVKSTKTKKMEERKIKRERGREKKLGYNYWNYALRSNFNLFHISFIDVEKEIFTSTAATKPHHFSDCEIKIYLREITKFSLIIENIQK